MKENLPSWMKRGKAAEVVADWNTCEGTARWSGKGMFLFKAPTRRSRGGKYPRFPDHDGTGLGPGEPGGTRHYIGIPGVWWGSPSCLARTCRRAELSPSYLCHCHNQVEGVLGLWPIGRRAGSSDLFWMVRLDCGELAELGPAFGLGGESGEGLSSDKGAGQAGVWSGLERCRVWPAQPVINDGEEVWAVHELEGELTQQVDYILHTQQVAEVTSGKQ
jgi:hypothetical protein